MKLIVDLSASALKNFYFVHNKIMSKYGYSDAYFFYLRQRVYVSGLPPDFFNILENWVGMQLFRIVFIYVVYVPDYVRNTYTNYGAYYTNTPIWFLPFNWYETKFIYWDSASSIRSGNSYFNIFSCQKFVIAPVKEMNDKILTGGQTVVAYDDNGNLIPPKHAPDGKLYPAQSFSVKYPIVLQGFLMNFVNNEGSLSFFFNDPTHSNFNISGSKTYSKQDDKQFALGIPLFRDSALPYNINTRQVHTTNLDYIQSFQEAVCGATITAYELNRILSPNIPNSDFIPSKYVFPQRINQPPQVLASYPIVSEIITISAQNNDHALIINIPDSVTKKYDVNTSVQQSPNGLYYGTDKMQIIFTIKNFTQTESSPPSVDSYQYTLPDRGLETTVVQGYYNKDGNIAPSDDYVCFEYETSSTEDLIYMPKTQQELKFQIVYQGLEIKDKYVFLTSETNIPAGGKCLISIRHIKDETSLSADTYNHYFSDKRLNYDIFVRTPDLQVTTNGIAQIATNIMYHTDETYVAYRAAYPDFDNYLVFTDGGLVYEFIQMKLSFTKYIVPANTKTFFIISYALNFQGAQTMQNIISNPGDYPEIISNIPSYQNQDIINVQEYPSSTDQNGVYSEITLSNYPVFTSGYFNKNKWVVSKYTQGIDPSTTTQCKTIVLDSIKNKSYYDNLSLFSITGRLPYEILITSKTIRQGIRMFSNIFRFNNHLEIEITAYVTVLLKPTWTLNQDGLYYSNLFTWPNHLVKFKYGAIVGFNTQQIQYRVLYSSLERIVYYKPKPFTLQTINDTFVFCREIEYSKQFYIFCDKPLASVLMILSNSASKTTLY